MSDTFNDRKDNLELLMQLWYYLCTNELTIYYMTQLSQKDINCAITYKKLSV